MKHNKKEVAIVYIITKLELGGAQKICLSLFNRIANQEFNTFLISGNSGLLAEKISSKHSSAFLLPSFKREVGIRNFLSEIKTFYAMIKRLKIIKEEYESVIVHTHSTKAGIMERWAAWAAGIKQRIHTVHGFGFHAHQHPVSWCMHYILEFFTSLITSTYICVSSVDAQTGKRLIPFFSSKHATIRAAIPLGAFTCQLAAKKEVVNNYFTLGCVACFKPQKNLFDLLQAFAHAHKKNSSLRLEIIGDGAQRDFIETWIKANNLTNTIFLLGWQDNVAQHMKKWQAFALSSLWEGLPCAVVEARALKIPVIAYAVGGIADVIFDKKNGLLIPPKNVSALSQAIYTLSVNKKLHKKLSSFKDDFYEFDEKVMIGKHISLYNCIKKSSSIHINASYFARKQSA